MTKRMPKERLFALIQRFVPPFLWLGERLGRIPFVGRYKIQLLPVAVYSHTLPLDRVQSRQWSILDTFDWYETRIRSAANSGGAAELVRRGATRKCEDSSSGAFVGMRDKTAFSGRASFRARLVACENRVRRTDGGPPLACKAVDIEYKRLPW